MTVGSGPSVRRVTPARTSARGLAVVVGLALLLAAAPAHAASPGGVLPSDPVVRLVLLGVAAGLLLVLAGGTGLWLTRPDRLTTANRLTGSDRPARTRRRTR